ncbi:YbjN domain-containing protein [Cyanobacteria bacterium FACHB-63]|nr:YbjN domain-containing protein [Cyanobacteria bacterium FACHB-63]
MITNTEHCLSSRDIALNDRSHSPLPIHSSTLTLTPVNECCLTFQINLETFQRIEVEGLFNLKPELRGAFSAKNFHPEPDIEIEATLQPDLLVHLSECTTSEDPVAYLQTLSQTQPNHPLLNTESWYALRVTQSQASGEIGYQTFWAYLNPGKITQQNFSSEHIAQQMIRFFREQVDDAVELNSDELDKTLDEISNTFENWLNTTFDEGDRAISDAIDEAMEALNDLVDDIAEAAEVVEDNSSIYQVMIDFFTEDDWAFTKLQGESILQLAFQGKHDRWTCYAKAREDQQQFVFYSICPAKAPKTKRRAIAEFLTRVNYGLIVGNFELDLSDGEIRYKTSIDVEGDHLSNALIKRLVYTNVMMVDEYLPGIKAVLQAGVSPEEAIQAIEQGEGFPTAR